MGAAGDAQSEVERQLIVFSLHGEHYGLPIASVQEIIRYTPPRVTATARGLVQGLINLRGRVLPVLDLSSRLGRALEVSDTTRILVIDVADGVLGLIVDGGRRRRSGRRWTGSSRSPALAATTRWATRSRRSTTSW